MEYAKLIEQYFEDGFPFVDITYNGVIYGIYKNWAIRYKEDHMDVRIANDVILVFYYDKIESVGI